MQFLLNAFGRELPPPPIWIKRELICQIMCTIGSRRPESGGILIGPVGTDRITGYYFDTAASCSGGTYSPDIVTLKRKMKEDWLPAGVDMKGFVHSHPQGVNRLSGGDLTYIRRLLTKNPDMRVFAAPIVLPEEF